MFKPLSSVLQSCIPRKGNFDLSEGIQLHRFLNHVMFCLQSHQYIVQHKKIKNGHTLGKKINQYHTHIAARRMLSRYQPFSVRCKQTHTSLKISVNGNDRGCIAG